MKRKEISDYVGILVSIIIGFIGTYGQIKNPQTSIIIFTVLLGGVVVYFLVTYTSSAIKEKISQINKNTESIELVNKGLNSIKETLHVRKDIDKLQVRMIGLEQMLGIQGKKGVVVNPQWVMIIIMIILLIVYMRSKGWF